MSKAEAGTSVDHSTDLFQHALRRECNDFATSAPELPGVDPSRPIIRDSYNNKLFSPLDVYALNDIANGEVHANDPYSLGCAR
jgi:hypothetical protein